MFNTYREGAEASDGGAERLVVLSWKRQKAGGRRHSLAQSHLIVSAMSNPCMGASSSSFEASSASGGMAAQKAVQAGQYVKTQRGSVSESLAALLESDEAGDEDPTTTGGSVSPRSDDASEANEQAGYDGFPVPAPLTTGSTDYSDNKMTALQASRSPSLRSAMKGSTEPRQLTSGVRTLDVSTSDSCSDAGPPTGKNRGSSKVMPVESNTDGRSESQSSSGSRSTMSTFHSAIEADRYTEEPSLIRLKKLLFTVAIFFVVITFATMIISRSAISAGMISASTLREGGDRLIEQQVCC